MEAKNDSVMREDFFVLRPLTHKQLAKMYGVSWLTFQNWIKKVEREVGKKNWPLLSRPPGQEDIPNLRSAEANESDC